MLSACQKKARVSKVFARKSVCVLRRLCVQTFACKGSVCKPCKRGCVCVYVCFKAFVCERLCICVRVSTSVGM